MSQFTLKNNSVLKLKIKAGRLRFEDKKNSVFKMLQYKAVSSSRLEYGNVFCRLLTDTDMGKESDKSTRLESDESEGKTSTAPESQATLDKWLQENKQVRKNGENSSWLHSGMPDISMLIVG